MEGLSVGRLNEEGRAAEQGTRIFALPELLLLGIDNKSHVCTYFVALYKRAVNSIPMAINFWRSNMVPTLILGHGNSKHKEEFRQEFVKMKPHNQVHYCRKRYTKSLHKVAWLHRGTTAMEGICITLTPLNKFR